MLHNLESYKNYLIGSSHSVDNLRIRDLYLNKRYNDNLLEEVIKNSYEFLLKFLEYTKKYKQTYYNVSLANIERYIILDRIADSWYPILDNGEIKYISRYLLKEFLGTEFYVIPEYTTEYKLTLMSRLENIYEKHSMLVKAK